MNNLQQIVDQWIADNLGKDVAHCHIIFNGDEFYVAYKNETNFPDDWKPRGDALVEHLKNHNLVFEVAFVGRTSVRLVQVK